MADVTLKIPKEPVFIKWDFQNVKIRTEPTGHYFLRHYSEPEKEVQSSNKLFADAQLYGVEITEKEYYAD